MNILISEDGTPFEKEELQALLNQLDALEDGKREDYRNKNSSAIAKHPASRFLIVSGPGTGKSHLFLERINEWFQQDVNAKVLVTSFVRKLVADLQADIAGDIRLNDEQRENITVSTLHRLARSIVEKNHGSAKWRFAPHFRLIGQSWKEVVWGDVLAFVSDIQVNNYGWKSFEEQLHNGVFEKSKEWKSLNKVYFQLCQFYNAAGFADVILRAKDALIETPHLNESLYFIVDEYQDFNLAEKGFINQLANRPTGILIVGDDDQVLYEKLKSAKPTLIRELYQNTDYANGMLPFCGRSSFHITKASAHFIKQYQEPERIEKIYLPITADSTTPKVRVIACATPNTAVDYIEQFVTTHKELIEERKATLIEGKEKDAFLLILTPSKEIKFYGQAKETILRIVSEYGPEETAFSDDYYKVLTYYSVGNRPENNFAYRKVLYYEDVSTGRVHELIVEAMENGQPLCDLVSEEATYINDKCREIKSVLETESLSLEETIDAIANVISVTDKDKLAEDFQRKSITPAGIVEVEYQEDEQAEMEELEVKKMGAVELITIVGAKGLSADHVIVIGFDNINMKYVTKNAFYVAITRARKSLHLLTALKSGGATEPHAFVDQLPDGHVEYWSYKKTKHTRTPLNGTRGLRVYLKNLQRYAK